MGCHGLAGRVPSFSLRPPDKYGYLPVKDLLFNYRVVQSKVRLDDPEKSKLLRKPLNIDDLIAAVRRYCDPPTTPMPFLA